MDATQNKVRHKRRVQYTTTQSCTPRTDRTVCVQPRQAVCCRGLLAGTHRRCLPGPAGFNRTWVRRTYRLGGLIGSAYFRPAESPAVPSARRLGRPKVRFNPSPPLVLGPQARRYTQKAVHTQGGTHKRRSVATAGVTLLKGPQAKRYTQKAVHTQGGTHKRRSVATAGVMLLKGPQARRYTQKAVHTQGGTHKRRSVATHP